MTPVYLLILGLLVVLGGILVLRLHPILALLLGALLVGALTSTELLSNYAVSKNLSDAQTAKLLEQTLSQRIVECDRFFADGCMLPGRF